MRIRFTRCVAHPDRGHAKRKPGVFAMPHVVPFLPDGLPETGIGEKAALARFTDLIEARSAS